ncbi:MAG: AMP-binding protein [Candidatus Dadabacteria bacterium]|nr:AMP-binding protein [Candidatus Dadabacteria bacterium]
MYVPALVHEYLSLNAYRYPEKEALIFREKRWTYRDIDLYSNSLANILIQLGMEKQDRVVIFLDNSSESVISLYGILKGGGIFVILNGSMKGKKLAYILKDSGATILITHTEKGSEVKKALKGLKQDCKIVWVGDQNSIPDEMIPFSVFWDSIMDPSGEKNYGKRIRINSEKLPRIIDQDLAALIYTSGSTGEPKGVMSSHLNMVSAARSIIQYLKNTQEDIIINVLPLSFDYGLYQVIMTFMFGGTIILEKYFLYPIKILQKIRKESVTGFPIVPTLLAILLSLKDLEKYDLSSIRYMTNTGASLPVEHIRKIRSLLPHVDFYSMFGLTECKRISYLTPEEIDRKPTSVGKPMPNCEVWVVDDQGNEVSPGKVGELIVSGSNVMKGYWNSPELTSKVYKNYKLPGDWVLYTGDLFKKDGDGYLYFIGRKDDLIKTKGERVSPKEIENIIHEMEGVSEVAVIGVDDEIFGQAIKVFIVTMPGQKLTANEILKYCSENLESFMVPKYIEFIKELPKTDHGKIDKKSLS